MKKFLAILLAVALALALAVSACAPAEEEEEEEAPSWIEVGHVASVEGMYAGFGEGNLFGIEAAIEDINALGGVYVEEWGTKIKMHLNVLESASDEAAMAGLAETLIDVNNVVALVGGILPPTMDASMAGVAEENGVPFIIHSGPYESWMALRDAYEPITYTFTSTFRIATPLDPPEDGYLIKDIGFDFLDAVGVTPTAIGGVPTDVVVGVYASDDGDGRSWYELMGAMLTDAGYTTSTWSVEPYGVGLFPMDTLDYSAIYNQWIADGVNVIWGNCPPPHGKALWTQAYAAGFRPKVIFAARWGLFWTDMEGLGELAVGLGLENWWHNAYDPVVCPGIGGTTPQSLHERWVDAKDQPLNPAVGWGYAMIQVLADAIERAGSLDGADIRDALEETDLATVAYRIKYDPADNNSPSPIYYFQWVWDEELGTVVPEVVVSAHTFIPKTEEAFLIP